MKDGGDIGEFSVVPVSHEIKHKWSSKILGKLGERKNIAQKGVRAIDARNSQLENGSNAAKNQCSLSRAVNG